MGGLSSCHTQNPSSIPSSAVIMCSSMAATLVCMGWCYFAFFYSAGRLGEILRCSREDLVLPEEVLELQGSAVFLRLCLCKSKMRQPVRVQHVKVTDRAACLLLCKTFKNLEYDLPLFGSTAHQHRK